MSTPRDVLARMYNAITFPIDHDAVGITVHNSISGRSPLFIKQCWNIALDRWFNTPDTRVREILWEIGLTAGMRLQEDIDDEADAAETDTDTIQSKDYDTDDITLSNASAQTINV